jgi:tetratricopeptide (TPR) repeat protein
MAISRHFVTTVALLATLLCVAYPEQASSRNERRGTEDRELVFPKATRDVAEGRVSSRMQRQINAMITALNDNEDPAKAREIADEVLANDRASAFEKAIAAQVAGNAAAELDDYQGSIGYLERAIKENALDNEAHYSTMQNLAVSYLNEERIEDAVTLLNRLIEETQTENADVHYALAGAYLQNEQYAEGIDALNKAIGFASPPKKEWRQLLMSAYLEADRPQDAATVGEGLLAESREDKRFLMTLASAYLDLDQDVKAIALLEDARSRGLLTEKRDYQTLFSLYFNAEGRERDVVAVIEEGLAKGVLERDLQTMTALGQAAYFSEDMVKALAAYKEAAALDPKGDSALNYAKVLSGEAQDAAALDAAKMALAKGVAKPGEAWMVIARAYSELDNTPALRSALQEAAKFPETRDQATRMLQQLR